MSCGTWLNTHQWEGKVVQWEKPDLGSQNKLEPKFQHLDFCDLQLSHSWFSYL